jgi:hypothetical protein
MVMPDPKTHVFYNDHAPPHQDELRDDWTLAEQQAPLKKIKPLE